MKNIFITGGLGYIGSHTCVVLIEAGFEVSIIDNLSNSNVNVLDRIESISGVRPRFYEGDVRNRVLLDDIFSSHEFDAVIHFAGLKAVGESVDKPIDYYDNNVGGSISLLIAMKQAKIDTLVFHHLLPFMAIPTQYRYRKTSPVQRLIRMEVRS